MADSSRGVDPRGVRSRPTLRSRTLSGRGHACPARRLPSARVLAAIGVVVVACYLALIAARIRHYGGNLSSLIAVGETAAMSEMGVKTAGQLGHHVVVLRHDNGYDGQWYYYVADDPFLRQRTFRNVFRYQRIGYPLVIWAVSLGRRSWRPVAMVGINLVAVLVIAYLSVLIITTLSRAASPWWALVCALNPSVLIGVQLDLAEPLAIAFSLAGLLLYLRRRIGWAALALAAALLTREVAILFVLPLLVAELAGLRVETAEGARDGPGRRVSRPPAPYRLRVQGALALAASVVPYLAWQAGLLAAFGRVGATSSEAHISAPLAGIGAVLAAARHGSVHDILEHQGSVMVMIIFVVVACGVAVVQIARRRDVIVGSILAHAVAALCASSLIWLAYLSAARVFGGMFPLAVFAFVRDRRRGWALLVAGIVVLAVLTVVRLVAIRAAQPYYLTP